SFQTPQNIDLLRGFLHDGHTRYSLDPESNLGHGLRYYPVRDNASSLLDRWGIRHTKPVIREETWEPDKAVRGTISGSAPGRVLTELPKLRNLEDLDAVHSSLTDAEAKIIARLPKLKSLALRDNPVGDLGVEAIANISSLERLDLSLTLVTDEG